jgi:hypothetical protein
MAHNNDTQHKSNHHYDTENNITQYKTMNPKQNDTRQTDKRYRHSVLNTECLSMKGTIY